MVMSLKDGLGLMSWARPKVDELDLKVDELDLKGRWVGITKIDGLDLMG